VLNLDAAVAAVVDRSGGASPDGRVYIRATRARREVAVLLLLDLSASTGDPVGGGGRLPEGHVDEGRVIDLERRAALLLGEVLARTGDPFAIHGFTSNGRHEVDYLRFKDLDAPWDEGARRRLRRIAPRLSTRMGAALRHAGSFLRPVRRDRRLVILLTDGEPSDVDVFEPDYLVDDAKHAVGELRRGGIHVLAVSLDRAADRYVRRIFGAGGYRIVDRLPQLPDALPRLYARLAR
jgi:nitric oxide reductase activation protein